MCIVWERGGIFWQFLDIFKALSCDWCDIEDRILNPKFDFFPQHFGAQ
jgi:hypothetical protein